jgi:hypothetical protein
MLKNTTFNIFTILMDNFLSLMKLLFKQPYFISDCVEKRCIFMNDKKKIIYNYLPNFYDINLVL